MSGEAGTGSPDSLPAETIISLCDRLLGEVGRRNHLFSWLRSADSSPGQWLPVDAYYPANRLVVVRERGSDVYEQVIPEHGLRLLALHDVELPHDPAAARAKLAQMLIELGPLRQAPERAARRKREPRERPVAQAVASLVRPIALPPPPTRRVSESREAAAARATRLLAARRALDRPMRSGPTRLPRPRPQFAPPAPRERAIASSGGLQAPNLLIGVALAIVLSVEVYLAIAAVAVGAGQLLLAVGIVLDGCSRAPGTVAAAKLGQRSWAWLCVVVGSPAVAGFTLFRSGGPVTVEPGPLGGLLALVAMGAVVVGLGAWALGI